MTSRKITSFVLVMTSQFSHLTRIDIKVELIPKIHLGGLGLISLQLSLNTFLKYDKDLGFIWKTITL